MMSMMPQLWPLVRSTFPQLAGWGAEFPPEFSEMIAFVDRFAEDPEMHQCLFHAIEKIAQSRPMTLVHGDLNCGNFGRARAIRRAACFSLIGSFHPWRQLPLT